MDNYPKLAIVYLIMAMSLFSDMSLMGQELTTENIREAIDKVADQLSQDPLRPAFHLTPPAGCMGDPNGGIYHDGLYHIFYGQHPFRGGPGGWYWAHATSSDLLHWEHSEPTLTPAFELGLNYIGSGSTIVPESGVPLAFYSASAGDSMEFWQAQMSDDLNDWEHNEDEPVLTLNAPGLPPYDGFWRDPFVFAADDRTFLIACADLFHSAEVTVPIFEAVNEDLTEWEYQGILFTYPKHKLRNFEVPEFRRLGDKWLFLTSSDAPQDRVYYFSGEFDLDNLQFQIEDEGVIDYSGHYYAQETIEDDAGNLYLMAWIPGWDRDWLPTYMNEPLKNDNPLWNGCFALPRKLTWSEEGVLMQRPVEVLQELRGELFTQAGMDLPVDGPITAYEVVEGFSGDQIELEVTLDLNTASFCGLNLLCDDHGEGGLYLIWSGDKLLMDGVEVPMPDWNPGDQLELQIFVDQQIV